MPHIDSIILQKITRGQPDPSRLIGRMHAFMKDSQIQHHIRAFSLKKLLLGTSFLCAEEKRRNCLSEVTGKPLGLAPLTGRLHDHIY